MGIGQPTANERSDSVRALKKGMKNKESIREGGFPASHSVLAAAVLKIGTSTSLRYSVKL